MTTTKNRVSVRFEAGGRAWHVAAEWPLFDLEVLLGGQLHLGEPVPLELQGYTLFLHEWGLLLQLYHPRTGAIVEARHLFWAFPDWLNHMERQGTPRARIVGDAGLQALQWHAQYLEWAKAEQQRHARWEMEENRRTPEELYAWCPGLHEDPEWHAYLDGLEAHGAIPEKGKGRPRSPVAIYVQELYSLALDIYRHEVPGVPDDWLSACWYACELRPNWVPKEWRVEEGNFRDGQRKGPGQRLYDLARKPHIAGTAMEDPLHAPVPGHWIKCRPPGWRGRKRREP